MKKIFLTLALSICFLSYSNAQGLLKIDTQKSSIHWYGYYTFYFGGHDGTIDLKEGYFIKTGDQISGGEFVIDMNTIKSTDIKNVKSNKSLVGHLKDPDFFDVSKHPYATLSFTKVEYHDSTHMRIEANMTIKGITKPINFQAEVNFEEKTMTTKFKIDRTRWDITYNSNVRDSAISDAIGFEVKISL